MKTFAFSPLPCALLLSSTLLLPGCGGSSSNSADTTNPNTLSVAARSAMLPPGDADCPWGGSLVETGIDSNGNGVLDDNEVDQTDKVCNGADGSNGLNSLVSVSEEAAGINCTNGGMRIETGLDANGNDILDEEEGVHISYACHSGPFADTAADETITGSWSFSRPMVLQPSSSAPPTPEPCTIYFDTDDSAFCFYDGSWRLLDGSTAIGSQCT